MSVFNMLQNSEQLILVNEHGEEFSIKLTEIHGCIDFMGGKIPIEIRADVSTSPMKLLKGLRTLTLQNKRLRDENEMLRAAIELLTMDKPQAE